VKLKANSVLVPRLHWRRNGHSLVFIIVPIEQFL